jgi:2-oxoglutarate dehydrogenase E2 component (dihydrolipoamide succinyltransferase)
MKVEIKVPKMGESIVEATIGQILKASGSTVRMDEEILEIETEKVNQVLPAPAAGRVELSVKTGDVVKVDQVIGTIETDHKPEAQAPTVTPVAAPPPPKSTGKETREKMTKLRRVIAERLVQVKNETAMLTTFNEVDMSAVIQMREREQKKFGFMPFFVKACVGALKEFPALNARIEGDEIVYCHYYDIGIAVGTDKGLFVPVIRNADQLSYVEIETQLKALAEKAREGKITVDEMQGGTFTITNGGVYGSMLSTPILNPPQSGILGMHNIVKRAVVMNDQVVIRPIMYLALSYDHRIVDGKESIAFLMHIKKSLEEL